jgi:hypothetical protein
VELDAGLGAEVEVAQSQIGRFLDPGASIVEEEDQGSVPVGMPSVSGQLLQEFSHLFAFQEMGLGR